MKYFAPALLLLVFSLVTFVPDAIACSCYTPPTVQEEFERSPIVMIARFDGIEELDRRVDGTNVYRSSAALMTIEKVYKGGLKENTTIRVFNGGGGDCSTGFHDDAIGQRYLFFTGPPEKRGNLPYELYWISLCSRSKRLEDAKPDLIYLDDRIELEGKTRLSGLIRTWGDAPPSVADLKVTISGTEVREIVRTDKNGFYQIWGLPPGDYSIEYQVPDGWKISTYVISPSEDKYGRRPSPPENIVRSSVAPGRHTELNVFLEIDNKIAGVVLSPAGTPMVGVCVSAYWLTPTTDSFRIPDDCTDESGAFSIENLPAGNYRLEINSRGSITSSNPFETFYYPNALRKEDAQVISVGAGVHVRDLLVRVAKTHPLVTIKGVLTFSDGRPFPDGTVRFEPLEDDKFVSVKAQADGQGNFSFKIPQGAKGRVSAETNLRRFHADGCPQIDKLVEKLKAGDPGKRSVSLSIDGQNSLHDLVLTIPIPYCKPKEN